MFYLFCLIFPIVEMDAKHTTLVKDKAEKNANSLQVFISKKEIKISENITETDIFYPEDGKAIEDMINFVHISIMKYSDSDISAYRD